MKRKIIIDGYNVIFQIPELRKQIERDLEGARERFLDSLSLFAQKKQADYTVVLDGDDQNRIEKKRWQKIRVMFSKYPQKADPLIKKILSEKKPNEDMVMVTSDTDLSNFARICGVKVEMSQKFAKDMTSQPENEIEKKFDHRLSDDEVEEWMKLFEKGDAES